MSRTSPWSDPERILAVAPVDEGDLRPALPGGLFAGSWPSLPVPFRVAIDGCLVGGASLKADAFAAIVQAAREA